MSRQVRLLALILLCFASSACYWTDISLPDPDSGNSAAAPDSPPGDGCHYDDPACYAVYLNVEHGFLKNGIPYIGSMDAPIMIAQFSDFACPHCAVYHIEGAEPIIGEFVQSGQAVYLYYPMHFMSDPYSDTSAYAALCAGQQDAYWQFHHDLFVLQQAESPDVFTPARMIEMAENMGLDGAALQDCMNSEYPLAAIDTAENESQVVGLVGTPSVYYSLDGGLTWQQVNADYTAISEVIQQANTGPTQY